MGYHRAGFEVVGVDIAPQKNYPFEFHRGDALTFPLEGFDAIHASPPCQAHSALRRVHQGNRYPDLLPATRERLTASGLPYVIENVPGAPMNCMIVLCGSMFGLGSGGRQLRRHRQFETSFAIMSPPCQHQGEVIGVYGNGGPARRTTTHSGGSQGYRWEAREAMGIDWMRHEELSQAIPPAYTEWIGVRLREVLDRSSPDAQRRSCNSVQGGQL